MILFYIWIDIIFFTIKKLNKKGLNVRQWTKEINFIAENELNNNEHIKLRLKFEASTACVFKWDFKLNLTSLEHEKII